MKDIFKYFEEGITITKNIPRVTGPSGGYTIHTPATNFFHINSLEELTPNKFEYEIEGYKEYMTTCRNMNKKTSTAEERKDSPHHHTNRED